MCDIQKQDAELKQKCQEKLRTVTDSMEKLRLSLLSRGSGSIKGMGRVFRIMDDDASRTLTFEEFNKGLCDYGVSITEQEAKQVFSYLDKDASGTLNFEEFLIALRARANECHPFIPRVVLNNANRSQEAYAQQPPMSQARKDIIMSAFKKMDKTEDGVITVADLKGVYNVKNHPKYQNGEWTEKQCMEEFLKSFEAPNSIDGKVTQDEFFNYYAGVSASVDDDAYFDLMMRNAWKL